VRFSALSRIEGESQRTDVEEADKNMTMLFFSTDDSEVQGTAQCLLDAGIPCEVRNGPVPDGMAVDPFDAELWIENDRDCYRALMLCVERGIGFAKRAIKSVTMADAD
jgi:hypothetical protein